MRWLYKACLEDPFKYRQIMLKQKQISLLAQLATTNPLTIFHLKIAMKPIMLIGVEPNATAMSDTSGNIMPACKLAVMWPMWQTPSMKKAFSLLQVLPTLLLRTILYKFQILKLRKKQILKKVKQKIRKLFQKFSKFQLLRPQFASKTNFWRMEFVLPAQKQWFTI